MSGMQIGVRSFQGRGMGRILCRVGRCSEWKCERRELGKGEEEELEREGPSKRSCNVTILIDHHLDLTDGLIN